MLKKKVTEMGRLTVEEFRRTAKMPVTVVLDNVRSLNNIGSIFRSCDGFAVSRIVLCGISATPPSPEIHKTALGAEDSVDWVYYPTTLEALADLRKSGLRLCCLELVHDSVALNNFAVDYTDGPGYAIVVGHEVDGVAPEVVDYCDTCIEIPQSGTKHSLNVAVSTAISLWHFYSAWLAATPPA